MNTTDTVINESILLWFIVSVCIAMAFLTGAIAIGCCPRIKVQSRCVRIFLGIVSVLFLFFGFSAYRWWYVLPEYRCYLTIRQAGKWVLYYSERNEGKFPPMAGIPGCFCIDFPYLIEEDDLFSLENYIVFRQVLTCPLKPPYVYQPNDEFGPSDQSYYYIGYKTSNPAEMQRLRSYLEKEIWSKKGNSHPPEEYGLKRLGNYVEKDEASRIPLFIERPSPRAPSKHELRVYFLNGDTKSMKPGEGWPVDEKTLSILQKCPMK